MTSLPSKETQLTGQRSDSHSKRASLNPRAVSQAADAGMSNPAIMRAMSSRQDKLKSQTMLGMGMSKSSTKPQLRHDNSMYTEILNHHVFNHHDWHWLRIKLMQITDSSIYTVMMSLVIVFNIIMIILDTDASISHQADAPASHSVKGLAWFTEAQRSVLVIYIADLCIRVFVCRRMFFKSGMNILDVCIILVDVALEFIPESVSHQVPPVMALRVLRMARIVRVLRSFVMFRELYLMMQGLMSAMRAIVFAIVLIAMVFTMFSIVAVHTIHPMNRKMHEEGVYGDCEWCGMAFESIWMSNMTFFKTIVAGDSWGLLAIPLIERSPWVNGTILLAASCTVQLGLLNLIVAIIVERASSARLDDLELQQTMKEEELRASYSRLQTLFREMDTDGSESLDLEELNESYDENEDFRNILHLMDISKSDLEIVFKILDVNKDGVVSYHEFVHQIHYVRCLNSHTLLVFILQHCEEIGDRIFKALEVSQEIQTVPESPGVYQARTESFALNEETCGEAEENGNKCVAVAEEASYKDILATAAIMKTNDLQAEVFVDAEEEEQQGNIDNAGTLRTSAAVALGDRTVSGTKKMGSPFNDGATIEAVDDKTVTLEASGGSFQPMEGENEVDILNDSLDSDGCAKNYCVDPARRNDSRTSNYECTVPRSGKAWGTGVGVDTHPFTDQFSLRSAPKENTCVSTNSGLHDGQPSPEFTFPMSEYSIMEDVGQDGSVPAFDEVVYRHLGPPRLNLRQVEVTPRSDLRFNPPSQTSG